MSEHAWIEELFEEALGLPITAIAYHVGRVLASRMPDRAMIAGDAGEFDVEGYAAAGLCELRPRRKPHSEIRTNWNGPDEGLSRSAENAWYEVRWEGAALDVLHMEWPVFPQKQSHCWIVAETREVAERFFAAVREWSSEVHGEVLVFTGGCWHKSGELHDAIRGATFDNLILLQPMKDTLREDLRGFFDARATYEQYGVPWKRGVLLVGPPGNGKTHTVKALINDVEQPCLYVSSFKAMYGPDDGNIRSVFARARQSAPCVLVFEDLDALVHSQNRSVFLNELDGFAANTGILTLATSNHPERLDPAILDRPSRFDRKYHFDLPAFPERRAYLAMWNERFRGEMLLTGRSLDELAAQTEEFSYAYLKELVVSAAVRWIDQLARTTMPEVMLGLVGPLREQMRTSQASTPAVDAPEGEEE